MAPSGLCPHVVPELIRWPRLNHKSNSVSFPSLGDKTTNSILGAHPLPLSLQSLALDEAMLGAALWRGP